MHFGPLSLLSVTGKKCSKNLLMGKITSKNQLKELLKTELSHKIKFTIISFKPKFLIATDSQKKKKKKAWKLLKIKKITDDKIYCIKLEGWNWMSTNHHKMKKKKNPFFFNAVQVSNKIY